MKTIYKMIKNNEGEYKLTQLETNHEKDYFAGIIPDSMDPTIHPCNGKYYTSKSQFRRVTKSRGLVELGSAEEVENYSIKKNKEFINHYEKQEARDRRQALIEARYEVEAKTGHRFKL